MMQPSSRTNHCTLSKIHGYLVLKKSRRYLQDQC